MPIYEYKCDACGHILDALQKIDEEPLKFCPSCSEQSLRKLISAPAFRLKGSGWYETDFKKDNKRNLADGGAEAKSTDGEKSGEKSGEKDKAAKPAKDSSKASSSGAKTDTKGAD